MLWSAGEVLEKLEEAFQKPLKGVDNINNKFNEVNNPDIYLYSSCLENIVACSGHEVF